MIRDVRAIGSGIPILLVGRHIGGKATLDALDAGADEVLKKSLAGGEPGAHLCDAGGASRVTTVTDSLPADTTPTPARPSIARECFLRSQSKRAVQASRSPGSGTSPGSASLTQH